MAKLFNNEKPRVLLVDADEDFRDLFKLLFERWFRLTTVSAYSQALELLKTETFDVIVVDIFTHKSPRGTKFLREIEQFKAKVPVVFTSNVSSGTLIQLTSKASGFQLIEKNFDDPAKIMKVASYIMAASCQNPGELSEQI